MVNSRSWVFPYKSEHGEYHEYVDTYFPIYPQLQFSNSQFCVPTQEEKRNLQDRLAQQQRLLSQTEQEKREIERNVLKADKEKKLLKANIESPVVLVQIL